MSWTDADTIQIHLQALTIDSLNVLFHPVHREGTDSIQLPHATLSNGTVRVYTKRAVQPAGPIYVTLTGTGWISLGVGPVQPSTVVLAKSFLLADRFIEGVDYAVEESSGQVKRLDGGSISAGASLLAWYMPLTLNTEGVDYTVDYSAGNLKPLPTGDLVDPSWLLVSYATSAIGATAELIGQAITEVEAKILDRLKDGYDASSTDKGLTIGATELTLSTLCDDLALRTLTAIGDASADDRARRLLELGRRYEERAISTLSKYLRLPLPAVSTRQSNTPLPSGW